MTPLGAVMRGAAAGVAGTIAMDLLWFTRYRRGGGKSRFVEWEFSTDLNGWDDAPAPAMFGKRLVEGMFRRELPAERAKLLNNAVHWATGVGWGAVYGLVSDSLSTRHAWHGLVFGASVWLQSYAVLVPAKLYKPMWEYDVQTLGKDLSAHLAYGVTTATAFAVPATKRACVSRIRRAGRWHR